MTLNFVLHGTRSPTSSWRWRIRPEDQLIVVPLHTRAGTRRLVETLQ